MGFLCLSATRPLNVEADFCRLGLMQRTYRIDVRSRVSKSECIEARKLLSTVGDFPFGVCSDEAVLESRLPVASPAAPAAKSDAMMGSELIAISRISSCGTYPLFLSSQPCASGEQ